MSITNNLNTQVKNIDSVALNSRNKSDAIEEDDDEDTPAVDMSFFLASGELEEEDINLFVHRLNADGETKKFEDDEELLHTRTYDLHITYDKYYQVLIYLYKFYIDLRS